MPIIHNVLHAGLAAGLALAISSCTVKSEEDHGHDHGHAHDPKFGGFLVELGDHFANLEIVHDVEAGSLTVYVLGAHAEETVKSSTEELALSINVHADEPLTFVLAADESSLSGNQKGASAKFSVTDERLAGLEHGHATVSAVEARGEIFEDVTFDIGGHGEDDHGGDDHEDHDGDDHDDHDGEDHDDHDGEDSDG